MNDNFLKNSNFTKNKRILITCGPTWVPIDDTRVISNKATGELGQALAKDLAKRGAKVTLLEGPVVHPLQSKSIRIRKFQFFDELQKLLNQELKKKYDVVIHAAAVSDYKLKKPFRTKLKSGKNLQLNLVPTPKLIETIKKKSPKTFLVGFKLESRLTRASAKRAVRELFTRAKCDLVVANTLSGKKYRGMILDGANRVMGNATTRKGIVEGLVKLIKAKKRI